jgi:hypothetical protein
MPHFKSSNMYDVLGSSMKMWRKESGLIVFWPFGEGGEGEEEGGGGGGFIPKGEK